MKKNIPCITFLIFLAFIIFIFLKNESIESSKVKKKDSLMYQIDTSLSDFFPTQISNKTDMVIITVPASKQRPFCNPGDYFWNKNGQLIIKVTEMNNWKYSQLVALHELVETQLIIDHGINRNLVDSFDFNWKYVEGSGIEEPGDDPKCPYHKEHLTALQIEHIFANSLGVNWDNYNKQIEKMQQ